MRAGWVGNSELQRRIQRDDPNAYPLIESVRTVNADIKDKKDDWPTGSGWEVLDTGGIRLTGSGTIHADTPDQTSTTNIVTDLDNTSPWEVVEVTWKGTNDSERELRQVTVAVDPDVDGLGSDVDHFRAKLYRVSRVFADVSGGIETQPISTHAEATTSGSSAQEITFDFVTAQGGAPRPGDPPIVEDEQSIARGGNPKTLVVLWAVASDGSAAGNAAWVGASSDGDETSGTGSHTLTHLIVSDIDNTDPLSVGLGTRYSSSQDTGMPRLKIEGVGLSQTTVTLDGTTEVDLGAAPESATDLEVVAQGEIYADSSVTYEISDDSGGSWTQVFDGDVIGEDNTADGGADLSSVARQQTYDMRATLTPDTTGTISPIVRRMGVRELEVAELFEIATVRSLEYSLDPLNQRSSIPELKVEVAKNGITDYRDFITELLSTTDLVDLELRVWIGHTDLARQNWLHVDSFLVDDYDPADNSVTLIGLHPGVKLRAVLPPFDATNNKREQLSYEGQTLKSVYSDLLSQISLPDRYQGAVVEDSSTTVSKEIDDSDGKRELEAIAYIAGGAVIASQGRLHFTPVLGADTSEVIHAFHRESIRVTQATPGFRERVPEFFVKFGFDAERDDFDGEVRQFHQPSLDALGADNLGKPEQLDDNISKWIDNSGTKDSPASSLAESIAQRVSSEMGVGIPHLTFQSNTPQPHIEIGDMVAVQTDLMMLKDPVTGADVRGILWAVGTVIRVHDVWGSRFTVWVRDYSDTVPAVNTAARQRFIRPRIESATLSIDDAGSVDLTGKVVSAQSIRYATSTSSFPTKSTTQSGTVEATDAQNTFEVTGIDTLIKGQTLFVSLLAYETTTGSGAESDTIHTVKITFQDEGPLVESASLSIDDDGNVDLTGKVIGAGSIRYATSTSSFPSKSTTGSGTVVATDSEDTFEASSIATPDEGQTLYVSILAYEGSSGGGTESDTLFKVKITRPVTPADFTIDSFNVTDDGTDDDYSVSWSVTSKVDSNYDMDIYYYREGTQVGNSLNVTATSGSDSFTDSGAGDSTSDDHSVEMRLEDGSGGVVSEKSQITISLV